MTKLIKEEGVTGRLHIDTPMMGESLVSKEFLKQTEAKEYFRMHPDINVLKIGGQSIMDRGAKALLPILDVLIEAKDKHKILLMTGGGTRARHVYNIGVDLGMPTGVLSKLGDKVSWQNAEMLAVLLSKHGGVKIGHGDNLEQLTMFCKLGYLPITYGIPPYGFFEHPAEHGSIPPHRLRRISAGRKHRRTIADFPQGRKRPLRPRPQKGGDFRRCSAEIHRSHFRQGAAGIGPGRPDHRAADPRDAAEGQMPPRIADRRCPSSP
jgi:hypothetical protein